MENAFNEIVWSEIAQGRQTWSNEGSCAGVGRDPDPHLAHDGPKPSLPPTEAGPSCGVLCVSLATGLNQDSEKIWDRLKFLEQKEKESKKLKRMAAAEHKRAEKVQKAKNRWRNPGHTV